MTLLIISIIATSAMTGFSYVISSSFRKLYKEPLLLEYLLHKLKLKISSVIKTPLAWLIHYLIGFGFVVAFDASVIYWKLPITYFVGLMFGILIGGLGIAGWETMFRLGDKPIQTDRAGYYVQLVFAHILFAFVTVTAYLH